MMKQITIALCLIFFISSTLDLLSKCNVKNPSKYRGKDPQFGEMIFGTSLPFAEEGKFQGISKTFTWGQFEHLEGRAYFPCVFGDIKNRLLQEVVSKGIFTSPYIHSHGWEMWIDEMIGDKVGEKLTYAGSKIEDMENDDDQLSCWIYDSKEGSDFYKVPGKSYPSGVELPFPDIFKNKPGKYHIQIQFYVQVKGKTGGGTWSQGSSGNWSFNPAEGYVNVGIAGGKFILIIP